MTLTSLSFFAFVLAALILYYVLPKRGRWIVLLAASLAFYSICAAKYLPYFLFTIISTWLGALWLAKVGKDRKAFLKENKGVWSSDEKKKFKKETVTRKRLILALILVLNFGILAAVKYYDYFSTWLGGLIGFSFPQLGIILPLGISFYTFQTMGYIIDVYWEKTEPEKNPAKFALFASFFPQIIQGPIAIYDNLAHQLYEGHQIKYENIKYGFQLILWGLFEKMVIADRLVVMVNKFTADRLSLSNIYSLLLVVIYSFQLYMDFAGGIDIARGVAQMFGIDMALNFKRPYFSKSVAEFWRRWHISLGHWLKTYLFYPLALSKPFMNLGKVLEGKKKSEKELPPDSIWGGFTFRQHFSRVFPGCVATLITFFVIGMWHGANWRYAGFGIWNGIVIMIAMLLDPLFKWLLKKLHVRNSSLSWRIWQMIRTYAVVMVGFAFDLGANFSDSIVLIKQACTPSVNSGFLSEFFGMFDFRTSDYIIMIGGLILVLIVSIYQERSGRTVREALDKQQIWFQWAVMLAGLFFILIFGQYGPGVTAGEFVYMGF